MMLVEGDAAAIERALAREIELWEAYRAKDIAALERLIDPLALDVGPQGVATREKVFEAVMRMEIAGYTFDELHLRSLGDLEIVTYRARVDGTYQGRPFAHATVRASSAWAATGRRWRLVHRQESAEQP